MENRISLIWHGPEETTAWGRRLGTLLGAGDIVALIGELGAGKTTLAQGIAQGLGVPEQSYIASPTFTLINEYQGRVPFYHIDGYRIDAPSDWTELGLDDYLYGAGVAVIEWADKMIQLITGDYLVVNITYHDEITRRAEVRATGARSAAMMKTLAETPR